MSLNPGCARVYGMVFSIRANLWVTARVVDTGHFYNIEHAAALGVLPSNPYQQHPILTSLILNPQWPDHYRLGLKFIVSFEFSISIQITFFLHPGVHFLAPVLVRTPKLRAAGRDNHGDILHVFRLTHPEMLGRDINGNRSDMRIMDKLKMVQPDCRCKGRGRKVRFWNIFHGSCG